MKLKDKYKIIIVTSAVITGWIISDLFGSWHSDFKDFDPKALANLETDMWRAYYNKEDFHLYRVLVKMLHDQQGFPFFRANYEAYLAAKAAVVFKDGHGKKDYDLALPYLVKYYQGIKQISGLNFKPEVTAKLELEWWIVHRERIHYGREALVKSVADAAGSLYGIDPKNLKGYAEARADAMIIRDNEEAGDGVSEKEWKEICNKLLFCYQDLYQEVNKVKEKIK